MGLMFRLRRPLARLAAGAATAGAAAHGGHRVHTDQTGERNVEHEADDERAAAGEAIRRQQYVPPLPHPAPEAPAHGDAAGRAAPPARRATADLDRLVELRRAGELSDHEFTAAKARLLGL